MDPSKLVHWYIASEQFSKSFSSSLRDMKFHIKDVFTVYTQENLFYVFSNNRVGITVVSFPQYECLPNTSDQFQRDLSILT